MSRQELADAVNAYAYRRTGRRVAVDARYVGKLERGEHRWPYEHCRTALREVLGKSTDAELGFFIIHGHATDPEVDPALEMPSGMPAPGSEDSAVGVRRTVGDAGGGLVVPGGGGGGGGGRPDRTANPTAVGQRLGVGRRSPALAAVLAVRERGVIRAVDGVPAAHCRCVGSQSGLPPWGTSIWLSLA